MNLFRSLAISTYRLGTLPYRKWRLHRSTSVSEVPIAVLYYHRVADHDPTPWTIDCHSFLKQIRWLKRHFDLISLDEAQRRMRIGNDRPAVCITFDDGYEDNAQFALPLLASLEIPTMYFVTLGYLDSDQPFPHDSQLGLSLRPNRIETLRHWVGSSIEFGGHTRTHRDLGGKLDLDCLFDEIVAASEELSALLQTPIEHFAFPFGHAQHITGLAVEMARQGGLKSISSAYGGWNQIGASPWHLQRMHADPHLSRFKNWLTGDPRTLRVKPLEFEISEAQRQAVREFVKEKRRSASISSPQAIPLVDSLATLPPHPHSLPTSSLGD